MTTQLASPEEARRLLASACGVTLDQMTFTAMPELKVEQIGTSELLDDPRTKAGIQSQLDAQQGFRYQTSNGQEGRALIAPFRDGFSCWVIAPNGMAVRL